MKKEGAVGAATLLALATVVGVSLQSTSKPAETGRPDHGIVKQGKLSRRKETENARPGCSNLRDLLEDFLEIKSLILPESCYEPGDPDQNKNQDLNGKTSQLKFVIATLPDPVHTHLPMIFDQFAVAVQDAAQDENFDFDGAWFPWDDEDSSYPLLSDQQASDLEKGWKEKQPGIILFREKGGLSEGYSQGLVVFVVGEEATHGIHKEQMRNALAWIDKLKAKKPGQKRFAILGPTFSGSFPSIAQILSDPAAAGQLELDPSKDGLRVAMFSGSVSGSDSAILFRNRYRSQIAFHSFVQSDDEILRRFCAYIKAEQPGFDPSRMAVISEDETAYGSGGIDQGKFAKVDGCPTDALNLFYPRDISALRAAYQTKSLFDSGSSSPPSDSQKKSLPTDLADPAGKVHDSIHTYGGEQTPLGQEAFLMEIVAALRELHARYIVLRGSNTLDQLFLANFLRRSYPDGRIVILGSDLMFIRERGSTGLSGTMTLSSYPLFPLERDWTEHQSLPAADRTFSSDTTEGTYVALRLLLNDKSLATDKSASRRCHVVDEGEINDGVIDSPDAVFVPRISCDKDLALPNYSPIPDYSPPFWTLRNQCGERTTANTGKDCAYPGPATWLSVIGVNRFWPLAALTQDTPQFAVVQPKIDRLDDRKDDPGGTPEMPVGMKVFLLALVAFSAFHWWCCWSGSYTAKPVFRAHFAGTGEWHHTMLIFAGSCYLAFFAVVAGFGSGVLTIPGGGLAYPWFAAACVACAWLLALGAVLANSYTSWTLSKSFRYDSPVPRMTDKDFHTWNYRACGLFILVTLGFYLCFILPLWYTQIIDNAVLTRWRAMHLASGVSPLMPVFSILGGLYLSFWFTLHGLALFGPDRPGLPPRELFVLKNPHGAVSTDEQGNPRNFLRMFSQEDAAENIEHAAVPFNGRIFASGLALTVVLAAAAFGVAGGVPVRSLNSRNYSIVFLLGLDLCCSLSIVEACRLYHVWDELRRLLSFLDRMPLRRTLASMRGFSWGSVWKMSGNVLEVRYKVISRQMECMNHTITTLQEFLKESRDPGCRNSLATLLRMRRSGVKFADWYSSNYQNSTVGDLTRFREFQKSIAVASGTILQQLLLPAWRLEKDSLLIAPATEEKEEGGLRPPPPSEKAYIRNAEEFVCLNYLSFIQNVLGRLRTMAMTIIALFVASACAMSCYPFDPRQALSAILVVLFVIGGVVIVKVYADMHRDATLSHVTNTKPGELGTEFWFKIVGFGLAPVIGLLTRIFPSLTDFIFSWLQPGIASMK